MVRYTRAQIAKLVGKSVDTIYRWEKNNKIPKPKKLAHNHECVYTEENLKAIREFMNETIDPNDGDHDESESASEALSGQSRGAA